MKAKGERATEDEMVMDRPWETVEDRSLACCSPWGREESDMA